MIDEGLVNLFDVGVVCAPCVDSETVFASEEVFEKDPVWRLRRDVDHALESDILVQPDRPAETVLDTRELARKEGEHPEGGTNPIVDSELVLEDMDTRLVDLFGSITLIFVSSIHGAPLSVPHTQSTLVQPLPLLLVRPDESPDLVIAASVRLRRAREPEPGVIVN